MFIQSKWTFHITGTYGGRHTSWLWQKQNYLDLYMMVIIPPAKHNHNLQQPCNTVHSVTTMPNAMRGQRGRRGLVEYGKQVVNAHINYNQHWIIGGEMADEMKLAVSSKKQSFTPKRLFDQVSLHVFLLVGWWAGFMRRAWWICAVIPGRRGRAAQYVGNYKTYFQ